MERATGADGIKSIAGDELLERDGLKELSPGSSGSIATTS
jgi:hypothetical protein